MKKSLFAISSVLVFSVLLSGCTGGLGEVSSNVDSVYSSEVESEVSSVAQADEETNTADKTIYRELSSGVLIDADINVPNGVDFANLQSFSATLKKLNIDNVKDDFIDSNANVSKTEQETAESPFENDIYTLYEVDDGTLLAGNSNMISYFSAKKPNIESYFVVEPSTEYNGDRFLTDTEFAFGTKQACFEEIKSLLAKLGVEVTDDYICYPVDHSTLSEAALQIREDTLERVRETGVTNEDGSPISEEEALFGYPDPNYTEDDDCYYFTIYANAGGFPITQKENGIFENGGYTPGSIINAIYSKDGIVNLYCRSIYGVNEISETANGADLEAAIQLLDDKYNSIIPDGSYEVSEISFEYVPISDGGGISAELVPAWRFQMKHTITVGDKNGGAAHSVDLYDYVLFNAITGKEILKDVGGV